MFHQHVSNESVAMNVKLIGTIKHGNFVTIINTIFKNQMKLVQINIKIPVIDNLKVKAS